MSDEVPAWAKTVPGYLGELKRCLNGQSAALIQDALADAEEYLRSAVADADTETERQVLATVVDTYGSPQEVAQEYIKMEQSIQSPFPTSQEEREPVGFFGVLIDPHAYASYIYMLLSLATGVFYFVWAITGMALTAGFAILIIGIPFALLFLGSIRIIGWVEGRLVEALLGVRMPRRLNVEPSDGTIWQRIKAMLADGRTWTSMLYMILMLPFGVAYFVIAVVGGSIGLACLTAPIGRQMIGHDFVRIEIDEGPFRNWNWDQINTFLNSDVGLIVLSVVGFFLVILMLHVARAIGFLHGKLAEGLLVRL
jgi:uncharacterized membrane protein